MILLAWRVGSTGVIRNTIKYAAHWRKRISAKIQILFNFLNLRNTTMINTIHKRLQFWKLKNSFIIMVSAINARSGSKKNPCLKRRWRGRWLDILNNSQGRSKRGVVAINGMSEKSLFLIIKINDKRTIKNIAGSASFLIWAVIARNMRNNKRVLGLLSFVNW